MNCKKCSAELENGVTLCPHCGEDNSVSEPIAEAAPAEVSENKTVEIKEGMKATPGKLILAGCFVLVLVALFVVLIAGSLSGDAPVDSTNPTVQSENMTDPTDVTEETVPPTAPADTGLNDASCKGSYTASDADVVAAADTVVATIGDQKLTVSQLQAYYWLNVRMFLSNNSYYLSAFGLDYTQPLDTQLITEEVATYIGLDVAGLTWQQFFLQQGLDAWHTYASLVCAAEEAEFELSQEDLDYLESFDSLLESDAETNGFDSVEEMVHYIMGPGATAEDYKAYEALYSHAYAYYVDYVNSKTFTDEELETFFDEHAAEYEANGLTKDMYTVDVRHILIMPEGATSATIRTETFPQEAWDASKAKAEQILQQWLEGEATEESFGLLANEFSEDQNGQVTNGGIYEGVNKGDMVASFDEWCFDAAREPGHYGIVETEFGYHIMYFVKKSDPLWPAYAENDLRTRAANELLNTTVETYPMEVDYKSILLGLVDLTQ